MRPIFTGYVGVMLGEMIFCLPGILFFLTDVIVLYLCDYPQLYECVLIMIAFISEILLKHKICFWLDLRNNVCLELNNDVIGQES